MTAMIDPLDGAISEVLRNIQGRKVTNKFLAEATGMNPRTLIRTLEGQRSATLAELRALTKALGTTVSKVAIDAELLLASRGFSEDD
jgi:transcriptional regulator with XRE-family HTH domain